MENRERDRVGQRKAPTDAGEINRTTSEEIGRDRNSGTDAEFGQSIGRSENLSEGGEMRNRNNEEMNDTKNVENESSRRPEGDRFGKATGRTGSFGNRGGGGADVSRDEMKRGEESSMDRSGKIGDSSEGRH